MTILGAGGLLDRKDFSIQDVRMEQRISLRDGRQIEVRNSLGPGDAGRVIMFHGEIYGREHNLGPKFEGYVAYTVGKFAEGYDASADTQRIWLASPAGSRDLAGCCALLDAGEQGAQFRWFLVDPAYRGAGLGRNLVMQAVEFARNAGYPRIFLYTSDFLPPAAKLYLSLGFSLAEQHPYTGWEIPFTEQKYLLELT